MGWSGDAHTLTKTVNRDRGESETGCWRASMRLAACAVAVLSPRWPVAELIEEMSFGVASCGALRVDELWGGQLRGS